MIGYSDGYTLHNVLMFLPFFAECDDRPVDPANGYIEVANNTFSMYKCDRGYLLNVSAIIRCHNGGKDNSNYWNTTNNVCLTIGNLKKKLLNV